MEFTQDIIVTVGTGINDGFCLNPDRLSPAMTLYGGRGDGTFLSGIWMENARLLEGETSTWSIQAIEGDPDNTVQLYIDNWDDYRANIHYMEPTGEGEVVYRVSVSAGPYNASYDIAITTVMERPDSHPTAIAYAGQTAVTVPVGGQITFDLNDLDFAGGVVPEGIPVWKNFFIPGEFYDNGLVADNGDLRTITFPWSGRFVVTAVIGYANMKLTKEIYVTVGTGINEGFGLNTYHLSPAMTVYGGRGVDAFLGGISLQNARLFEGETSTWSIQAIEGDPNNTVLLYIGNQDNNIANIHYKEPTGEGEVVYRVSVSAGPYNASYDIAITTVLEKPDSFPTAIAYAGPTQVNLNLGDSYSFDLRDITFADGSVPEGKLVWTEVNPPDDFNWNDLVRIEGDLITVTFPLAGDYQFHVAKGFENLDYTLDVLVTVHGDVE
jgi:hypothetical protein